MPTSQTLPLHQRGVALISVMLVFALIAMLAAQILERHFRDLRRSAALLDIQQANYYALGAEELARQILYRDYQQRQNTAQSGAASGYDGLQDNWALLEAPLPIDLGYMQIRIRDAQGLFNLNSLVDDEGKVDPLAVDQLRRLLVQLKLPANIAAQLQDWLDSDQNVSAGGAEDSDYLRGEEGRQRYLTGATALADSSELLLLKAVDFAAYQTLQPYVTALPRAVAYNINTLDIEVLRALGEKIDLQQAQRIEQRQRSGGFRRLDDWLNSAQGGLLRAIESPLGVASEYFEIDVEIGYGEHKSYLQSLLHRSAKDGKMRIIKRQRGRFGPAQAIRDEPI